MRFLKATLLLFLSVTISVAASAEEGGILGVWIVKEETRRGEQEYTLTLSDDGGTWEGGRGSSEISDLTIGENVLSFSRAMSRGGEETVLKYTSKLVDGMLVGTIASAQGEREFTASRIPESVLQAREDRKVAIAALETCDILGVFAHPDDETFAIGTFAKLSANGKRIQLVYATSGDAGGDQTGQGLTGDALAKYREGEMNAAADVMNVSASPLYLRYPDGFVRDHWDDVLGDVQSIMEKTAPKIIVSFGPDGYYGHSDHLAIGQIAERAFDELGSASHLLHVAIPKSINDRIISAGGGNRYKAVHDKYITYIVNVKKLINQRIKTMEAHASQFDKQTISQMRMLGAMTGYEGFVEVRNLGESGTLAEMFSEGDVVRKRTSERANKR